MKASESAICSCQFNEWYPTFADKTFKSRIIPLDEDFVNYLGEDGVMLPDSSKSYFSQDELSDEEEGLTEVIEDLPAPIHDFSELEVRINNSIKELGGKVMVKLNWSCPSDATWANGGTLLCQSISDIYMLLKSSTRVTFDIESMFDICGSSRRRPEQMILIIRKWANLNPSMEFRVFIYKHQIVGICQRDCCTFYDFLLEKSDYIHDHIQQFFLATVKNSSFPLDSYIMDVYIDRKDRVWIVDFNPFGDPSCPLLFEWQELLNSTITTDGCKDNPVIDCSMNCCEVRLVESASDVLQSTKGSHRGPIDVHAAEDFKNFIEICKSQN